MAGHTEGASRNEFCSVRAETCDCGNKYQAPCDAKAKAWEAASAGSSLYAQKYKDGARKRGAEAHHILCVASVTGNITVEAEIERIVWNTKWCINVANNMIALPMWAHTVSWYVDLDRGKLKMGERGGKAFSTVKAPPFQNLVQHDYDHGQYIKEVDADLEEVVENVKADVKDHENPASTLADALDRVITKRKAQLEKPGTHANWQLGMNEPEGLWYVPFSMATVPTPRAFPPKGRELLGKIASVRDAFLKLPPE